MTTEFLHVLRDRSLVRTDREVKIVEGGRSLQGRGMEYNNEHARAGAAQRRARRASKPNERRMKRGIDRGSRCCSLLPLRSPRRPTATSPRKSRRTA